MHDGGLGGKKPIKITISDPESGEVIEEKILMNDYCLIVAGNRYLKSQQIMGTTHMLAIAVEKPLKEHP